MASAALTTGLGDIMGMSQEGLARFGRFAPLERVLLTANGNLQRIVSSYYDAPVSVVVLRCVEKAMPSAPNCVAAFDREVELLVGASVFCVAESEVRLHTPEALEAVSSGAVGIGQLYRHLDILPQFTLQGAGKNGDGSFWRKYELASSVVSCVIHERFSSDVFSKDMREADSDGGGGGGGRDGGGSDLSASGSIAPADAPGD